MTVALFILADDAIAFTLSFLRGDPGMGLSTKTFQASHFASSKVLRGQTILLKLLLNFILLHFEIELQNVREHTASTRNYCLLKPQTHC